MAELWYFAKKKTIGTGQPKETRSYSYGPFRHVSPMIRGAGKAGPCRLVAENLNLVNIPKSKKNWKNDLEIIANL
jgi:hypothetical protein